MSGGAFGYDQYKIGYIADQIEQELIDAEKPRPPKEEYDYVSVWKRTGECSWRIINDNIFDKKEDYIKHMFLQDKYEDLGDDCYRRLSDGAIFKIKQCHYSGYKDGYEDTCYYGEDFTEETKKIFKKAIDKLREAEIYVQRIDWYLSGDDDQNSLSTRLKDDLEEGGFDYELLFKYLHKKEEYKR